MPARLIRVPQKTDTDSALGVGFFRHFGFTPRFGQMASSEVDRTVVASSDGTQIAVHDTGGDLPPIVLANGLGGPFRAWKHQIDYLRDQYRIVSWDYRGLYGSSLPKAARSHVDVGAHVDDPERVLEATGIERAPFLGWSMGVQVVLELYERRPEVVSHLVLVNGTYGKALDTIALPLASRVVPRVVSRARSFHDIGSRVLKRASQWPETVLWLKRLGLAGATLDEELFRELAIEFGTLDVELYLSILKALGEHDASHVLPSITVPALVITGDRDAFTPRDLAQQMARRIPNGEILVIRGATHYAAIEYPELVNLRIEKFLREHAY